MTHPRLGPPIQDWRAHGAIDHRTKVLAVLVMVATLGASWAAGVGTTVLLVQAAVLTAAGLFVVTRPDVPGDDA